MRKVTLVAGMAALLSVLFLASVAHAVTFNYSPEVNATIRLESVTGLMVGDTMYQAQFHWQANFNEYYAANPDMPMATFDQATALMNALGSDNTTWSWYNSGLDHLNTWDEFFAPYNVIGSYVYGFYDVFGSNLASDDLNTHYLYRYAGIMYPLNDNIISFVVFSEMAPTPVPGAVWLLGTGLCSLFGAIRMRKS